MQLLVHTWFATSLLPWTVLKAKPPYRFVCSDRPLTMHDPTPPHSWSALAWESSPLVESTLPGGRDLCLRIGPGISLPVVAVYDPDPVECESRALLLCDRLG